jgi:hypothetical protein
MPRSKALATCLLAVLCSLVLVAPLAGCSGTKKKSPLTIAERIKKARAEKSPGGPARELAKVARLQAKSGDKAGAIRTLSEARGTIADDADAAIYAPRLIDIAAAYATIAEKNSAREAIDTATAMAERLDDQVARVNVLAKIGEVYGGREAGLGDAAKAQKVLAQAGEIAAGEGISDRFRPQALAAVALGYANANLAGDANAVTAKLESLAASLQDLRPKAEALAAAANVRAKSGAKEKATALLAEAAKAAKAIDGSANKTFALLAVARAMKAAGDTAGATALAAEAEKTSAKIGDPEQQKEALQEVRAVQAEGRKASGEQR